MGEKEPRRRWFTAIITAHRSPGAFTSVVNAHTNTITPLPLSFFFWSGNLFLSSHTVKSSQNLNADNNFSLSPPPRYPPSPPRSSHLTDPWKKPCRSSQRERVRRVATDVLNAYCPYRLTRAVLHLFMLIYMRVFLPSSAGLHETLALLTSQLRPDANHKEDMVFLKDVFSERSLGYLMKVRFLPLLIPWVTLCTRSYAPLNSCMQF